MLIFPSPAPVIAVLTRNLTTPAPVIAGSTRNLTSRLGYI